MSDLKYSVIIPVLNEARYLAACLSGVRAALPSAQIIVADGGSVDGTPELARREGVEVCSSPSGRGRQMNAGARSAAGDVVLFLHADSVLPFDAQSHLESLFKDPAVKAATFRLAFDHDHRLLKIYAYFTRFDSFWTRFGDQCIVARKDFFEQIGGFPEWPLLEDVRFLQNVRRQTRVHSLRAEVRTSARRFIQNGLLRQQFKNAGYLLQYLAGVSPEDLARKYYKK